MEVSGRSQRARICAAIDEDVLSSDEAGMDRAEERAGRAEAGKIAEALGRDALDALKFCLLVIDALALGGGAQHRLEPVGLERAGQEVVDRYIMLRHRTRHAGKEDG